MARRPVTFTEEVEGRSPAAPRPGIRAWACEIASSWTRLSLMYLFGAELAPDRKHVWFRITPEAIERMADLQAFQVAIASGANHTGISPR